MRSIASYCVLFIVFVFVLGFSPAAQAGPALEMMTAKEKTIRNLLATPTVKGTEAHLKKETTLRSVINEMFDFEELGKRALIFHWDSLTPEQRIDFLGTLQALIEKNYLLRIAGSTTYKLKWFGEAPVPDEDYTVVRFKLKSGNYKAAIQFRTIVKNGKPVIFDMLIDDVSLMENYRSQFNKIIRKDGFNELMAKMKRKLGEMDAPAGGKIGNDSFDKPAAPAPTAPAATP